MSKAMNERLKIWRENEGLTQAALGERLGMQWYQIKDIESGKVKITPKIEKMLYLQTNINIRWFKSGEGPMAKDKTCQVVGSQEDAPNEVRPLIDHLIFIFNNGSAEDREKIYGAISMLYDKVAGTKAEGMKEEDDYWRTLTPQEKATAKEAVWKYKDMMKKLEKHPDILAREEKQKQLDEKYAEKPEEKKKHA